jgi:hypothetical protein
MCLARNSSDIVQSSSSKISGIAVGGRRAQADLGACENRAYGDLLHHGC